MTVAQWDLDHVVCFFGFVDGAAFFALSGFGFFGCVQVEGDSSTRQPSGERAPQPARLWSFEPGLGVLSWVQSAAEDRWNAAAMLEMMLQCFSFLAFW